MTAFDGPNPVEAFVRDLLSGAQPFADRVADLPVPLCTTCPLML
jgi:hypothetical protein